MSFCIVGTLTSNDATATRTSKKTNRFSRQKVLDTFFVIFLTVLHNEDVKMPNFTF